MFWDFIKLCFGTFSQKTNIRHISESLMFWDFKSPDRKIYKGFNLVYFRTLSPQKKMRQNIQKHIAIPINDWDIIKAGLDRNGQKLSPLCNVLLRDYFKILQQNREGSN